jgi:hypothetical protein
MKGRFMELPDRLLTAQRLRLGVQLTPEQVDAVLRLVSHMRSIRAARHIDPRTRNLCNLALEPFDDE